MERVRDLHIDSSVLGQVLQEGRGGEGRGGEGRGGEGGGEHSARILIHVYD